MLESIWDDANLKGVVRRAAYGEGDTVDGDTALVHTEIPPAHHVLVALILESELMRAFLVLYGYATGRLVHMPLDDMAVQPAVHQHGTLHINFIAHGKKADIRTLQSLAHGGDGVGAVLKAHHCEAYSVVRHALVNTQLLYEGA